jgi:glycine cleavage system aminomethyltransferase T
MLGIGIGLAYLPTVSAEPETRVSVDLRGRARKGHIVKKPIYKREGA